MFCSDDGDCTSLHVKWGHPSTYKSASDPTAYVIPDHENTVRAFLQYILGPLVEKFDTAINGSEDFTAPDNPLKLTVTIDIDEGTGAPKVEGVTWSDVSDQAGHLFSIPGAISQGFGGLLWDMNDASRIVGSYSLGPK